MAMEWECIDAISRSGSSSETDAGGGVEGIGSGGGGIRVEERTGAGGTL